MKWLIWREYRLNRLILIVGLVLLLLPYVIALLVLWWAERAPDVMGVLFTAALYSLGLSQLTVALLGGNAIAGERADRSAQFVAYLPLSRTRRLASKLILAAAAVAVLWVVNLPLPLMVLRVIPELEPRVYGLILGVLGYGALTGLTLFSGAWLVSSLQSSPTFAVCAGLVTPFFILMGLHMTDPTGDTWDHFRFVGIGYAVICPIVAIACFSIGTWHFLRRVEP